MEQKIIKTLKQPTNSGTIVELVENGEGRQFVVKRIQNLEAPIYEAIFQKETQALLRLKACDNIVRIYHSDIQVAPNGYREGVISMEYVPGRPLSQMLDIIPDNSTRYHLVKQLTNAIRHAHQNSVIHRDITPSNILVTEDFELKLIDFGIAKIRGMFQSGTTYQFATQNYSAPEVALHSENATERSDIYSLGAVIYFLFTGNPPPTAMEFSADIDSTGGIDVKLKQVLLKMCAPSSGDRYENIDDCELALSPLYQQYCGSDERYYFSVSTNALDQLKQRNLVRRKTSYQELLDVILPSQFAGSLIRIFQGEQSVYCFDGINISMRCVLTNHFFQVVDFQRLDTYKREQRRKFSLEAPGHFQFVFSHRIDYTPLPNNFSEILANRIEDFQDDIRSQKNIDREYDAQYGIWRQFIQAMIADASQNAVRLYYTNVQYQKGELLFRLEKDGVPDENFSQDTLFIFEQSRRSGKRTHLIDVGTFLEFREDGAILAVKASPRKPKLPEKGSICLDYRKEIQQYHRQEAALEEFCRSETANSGNLKGIFVGVEQPSYFQLKSTPQYYDPQLDFTQKRAVRKVLEADNIALIQGPPGTGKTNVLVEVVRQILGENQRNPALNQKILIVSQSHAAVDKILEDLNPFLAHTTTVRIGRELDIEAKINERFGLEHCQTQWVDESVEKCTRWLSRRLADQQIPFEAFCSYAQVLEELKVSNLAAPERARLERAAADFEETCGKIRTAPYIQGCLIAEQWIRRLRESGELGEYYIKDAAIVAGTCIGVIADPRVRDTVFDYVIVDEAAKATLPEIMVPLVRAHKAILVGDHKQLPPVFDREALAASFQHTQIAELQNTGFGKLFDMLPDNCKETLSTQYRMHPCIGDLISHLFYDGKVQNGVSEAERSIELPMLNGCAITWLSTSKAGRSRFEQPAGHNGKGFINPLEVTVVQQLLQRLDQEIAVCGKPYSIGIITPYRAQLELIRNRLKQTPFPHIQVDINTVDAFQGSQRDIIIYSTVRSSGRRRIGFLKEEPRLNVAFSRAKRALIIVGDGDFLADTRIPDNRFPFVQHYMRTHAESCRQIDIKELTNVI